MSGELQKIDDTYKKIYEVINNSKLRNDSIVSILECIKLDIILNGGLVILDNAVGKSHTKREVKD